MAGRGRPFEGLAVATRPKSDAPPPGRLSPLCTRENFDVEKQFFIVMVGAGHVQSGEGGVEWMAETRHPHAGANTVAGYTESFSLRWT